MTRRFLNDRIKKKLCRIYKQFFWWSTEPLLNIFVLIEKKNIVIDRHRWDVLFLSRKYGKDSKILCKFPQVWQTLHMYIYQLAITFSLRFRIAELWHDTYTCATYLWIRFVNSIRKSVDVSVEFSLFP